MQKKINYNRLKAVLAENNMDGLQLSKKLGVTPQTVSRWCTNKSQPSVQDMYQIAILLNIDIRSLLVSTKNDKSGAE